MSETQSKGGQRRRYPSLNLEQALERAAVIYAAERFNPVPVEVITEHWGFSSHKTGPASTAYSAVKQFGLLEESGTPGQRKAKVSQRARAILTAPEDVRLQEIRAAALEPQMNNAVWARCGADPGSDSAFRWMLVDELGFSDTGAREFAKQYRATIAFAEFDDPPRTSEADEASEEDDSQTTSPEHPFRSEARQPAETALPAASAGARRHAIPLFGGQQVVLEGDFPLTEEAWTGFMAVLQAFKPGLVKPDQQQQLPVAADDPSDII